MKYLIFLFTLFIVLSTASYAQTAQVQQLIFPASGDSVSASILLRENVVPAAVWTDSLNTVTTFKPQIGFSYSTTVAPTVFYNLCGVSDTTVYSINLRTGRVIPFEPTTFFSMLGTTLSDQTHVWFRGILGADQTSGKIVFVRLNPF